MKHTRKSGKFITPEMKGTHYEIPSFYGLIHSIADNSRMYRWKSKFRCYPNTGSHDRACTISSNDHKTNDNCTGSNPHSPGTTPDY
jgi:hypothetical protein